MYFQILFHPTGLLFGYAYVKHNIIFDGQNEIVLVYTDLSSQRSCWRTGTSDIRTLNSSLELFQRNKEMSQDVLGFVSDTHVGNIFRIFPIQPYLFNFREQRALVLLKLEPITSQRTSTFTQAARGAFATRAMKQGSVVVPTLFVPVSRFRVETSEDDAHQLLRNYCYEHFRSSLLLCPYGSPAAYVNHAANDRANVRLVWLTTLDSKHEQWSNPG